MLQVGFGPLVAISAGVCPAGNGHLAVAHRVGEGSGAEIGVAAKIGGDHIQAELESLCHAASVAFGAMQGEKYVATSVKGKKFAALEALSNEMNAWILCGPKPNPFPLGAKRAGRESFDQQGNMTR